MATSIIHSLQEIRGYGQRLRENTAGNRSQSSVVPAGTEFIVTEISWNVLPKFMNNPDADAVWRSGQTHLTSGITLVREVAQSLL